jgi:hypothetical protein
MTAPSPLYALELEGGGVLTVARDVSDPQGLVLSVATHPVAIAAPVPRSAIQHLVQALDDFLYDSRP